MQSQEPAAVTQSALITFREVTRENLGAVLHLKVAPHQEQFVASNAVSIAQAHFEPELAWFRAIYADETPVGFVMLADDPINQKYFLWRFMIDARYQARNFGRRALQMLIDYVRTRPGATALLVSCVQGEGGPGPFYEKLGFRYTGEIEDGELVLRLDLV